MNTIMSGMGRCRSCQASIRWLKTKEGKNMPVNPETTAPEDTEFDPKRHISHWATCKDSAPFRTMKVIGNNAGEPRKPCNCGGKKNEVSS